MGVGCSNMSAHTHSGEPLVDVQERLAARNVLWRAQIWWRDRETRDLDAGVQRRRLLTKAY